MDCQQEPIVKPRAGERIGLQCSIVIANGIQVGEGRVFDVSMRGCLVEGSVLGRVNTNGHFYAILRTWKLPTHSIAKSSRVCRRHAAT